MRHLTHYEFWRCCDKPALKREAKASVQSLEARWFVPIVDYFDR